MSGLVRSARARPPAQRRLLRTPTAGVFAGRARCVHGLSHVSPDGQTPRMVDVSKKDVTLRTAVARSEVELPPHGEGPCPFPTPPRLTHTAPLRRSGERAARGGLAGGDGIAGRDAVLRRPAQQEGPRCVRALTHSLPSSLTLKPGSPPPAGWPGRTTAIIAGVQGVKRTSELIPFCHPLPVTPLALPALPFRPHGQLCCGWQLHHCGVEVSFGPCPQASSPSGTAVVTIDCTATTEVRPGPAPVTRCAALSRLVHSSEAVSRGRLAWRWKR